MCPELPDDLHGDPSTEDHVDRGNDKFQISWGQGYPELCTQAPCCPLYCDNGRKHRLVRGNSQGLSLDIRPLLCGAGPASKNKHAGLHRFL